MLAMNTYRTHPTRGRTYRKSPYGTDLGGQGGQEEGGAEEPVTHGKTVTGSRPGVYLLYWSFVLGGLLPKQVTATTQRAAE